jgi:ACS family hexuronate transporter-like MFS transporter
VVCALLFFATTINYMDRQILASLAPGLGKEIGWTESEYGLIVTAFQASYALGLLGAGRLIDRLGVGRGYPLAVTFWSLAAMAHAAARSAFGFAAARFALGLGEGGNFPAAVKVVAEWFPKQERALATGVFNAGSNLGAIAAPVLVPWITLRWGWRWAFLLIGATGFAWIVAWWKIYHPAAKPAAEKDACAEQVPWLALCSLRQTWGLVAARFLTDPVWWFYLYWMPKFLYARYGVELDRIGPPLVVVYLAADGGSIFGGWFSGWLLGRGWSLNAARKTALLACALMVAPIVFVTQTADLWTAVLLLGLATAGHQGWAANIFTLVSDMYPRQAVGSMVGICGFGASVGGMLVSAATGLLLQVTGSYVPLFTWAGSAYFVSLLAVHLAPPRLRAVEFVQARG